MSWLPKKTVVVPVDFSTASADALQTALQLVARPKDLHVIHVAPSAAVAMIYGDVLAIAGPLTSRLAEAGEHLARFLCERGAAGVTSLVREGDPGLMIADYADEVHADLIVMPSHGYHGVKRLLLGSVTERVLRHANCPVLVLRRPE